MNYCCTVQNRNRVKRVVPTQSGVLEAREKPRYCQGEIPVVSFTWCHSKTGGRLTKVREGPENESSTLNCIRPRRLPEGERRRLPDSTAERNYGVSSIISSVSVVSFCVSTHTQGYWTFISPSHRAGPEWG